TIVAGKDDDCVVAEPLNVERLQNAADIGVEALHHGHIRFLRAAVAVNDASYPLRLDLVVRTLPRPMRRGEMQAEQERLLGSRKAMDGLHCPAAKMIVQLAGGVDRHLLLVELARLRAAARMIEAMIVVDGRAGEDAVEVVITALERTEVR